MCFVSCCRTSAVGQRPQSKRGDSVKKLRKRIYSGVVLEQITFNVSDRVKNIKEAEPPRPRFKTEEERERHRAGISMRHHAQLFNENFSPTSLYSTLTFDDDNELHSFSEARQIRRNFRRALKREFPDSIFFIYMGRGKSTHRIHFHMVSEGVPKDSILEKWKYGSVARVSNLRPHNYYNGIDHGQDYTGLANYLWNHWTSEQGGHRWFMTKNAKKPDYEPTEEVKLDYTPERPPKTPKGYLLVDAKRTAYGYCYFKFVKILPPQRKGRKRPPPTIS